MKKKVKLYLYESNSFIKTQFVTSSPDLSDYWSLVGSFEGEIEFSPSNVKDEEESRKARKLAELQAKADEINKQMEALK